MEQVICIFNLLFVVDLDKLVVWLVLGYVYKMVGVVEQVVEVYKQVVYYYFLFGDVYWSLVNMKFYWFINEEISKMQDRVELLLLLVDDKVYLCFVLGKVYEDSK